MIQTASGLTAQSGPSKIKQPPFLTALASTRQHKRNGPFARLKYASLSAKPPS